MKDTIESGNEEGIKRRLVKWAKETRVPSELGYCLAPEGNMPWLTADIRKEVGEGDGQEFGLPGERAKICALHSSSALAINFFGYWASRERGQLQRALRLDQAIESVHFEGKFATGVGSKSPNLDVVLDLSDGRILAIESKFTEWFGTSGQKALRDAYFNGERRWADAGLPGAQVAAETYMGNGGFARLDVPQLLKHMLGLAMQPSPWQLMLLWYEEPGKCATEMNEEIARFKTLLGEDAARFSSMTYQELWRALAPQLQPENADYAKYMAGRYFGPVA